MIFVRMGRELSFTPLNTVNTELTHEATHMVPADLMALTAKMTPQPVRAITRVIRGPFPMNHRLPATISDRPVRWCPDLGRVIRPLRKPERAAHRRDREPATMPINEPDRHFRCGLASRTKKSVAAFKISIVRC